MPRLALFAMTNVGLPGTSSFVGEFLVIMGAVRVNFWIGAITALTLILSAAYTLWALKRVMFGTIKHECVDKLIDLSRRQHRRAARAACQCGPGRLGHIGGFHHQRSDGGAHADLIVDAEPGSQGVSAVVLSSAGRHGRRPTKLLDVATCRAVSFGKDHLLRFIAFSYSIHSNGFMMRAFARIVA